MESTGNQQSENTDAKITAPKGGWKGGLSFEELERLTAAEAPENAENPSEAPGDGESEEEQLAPAKALHVTLSHNRLKAYVRVDPRIQIENAERAFQEMMKVLYGMKLVNINEDLIRSVAEGNVPSDPLLVAEGRAAVDGDDADVIFYIGQKVDGEAMLNDMGRVDYKSINKIDNVDEGDLLAEVKGATDGRDGYTVTGVPIKAKRGKRARIPAGRNVVINEERTEARAGCQGIAKFAGGRLTVDKVFNVKTDVNLAVGNIDFVGDVVVGRNVQPDFVIKAKGSVRIGGDVDKADISSEKDIEIRGGLFGRPESIIEASNDVKLSFAENAVIRAHNNVVVKESLMQCNVRAGNKIIVENRSGPCVVGGRIAASGGITVTNLGSPTAEVKTVAQIEADPRLKRLARRWEEELYKEERETDPDGNPRRVNKNKVALLKAKLRTVEKQIEKQQRASIDIQDVVYPGVAIIINGLRILPNSGLCGVRFQISKKGDKVVMLDLADEIKAEKAAKRKQQEEEAEMRRGR